MVSGRPTAGGAQHDRLIRALFPCGSVTGAPKIRAMELIEAVEGHPRGPYCGAIGHVDPPQRLIVLAAPSFNVAIRTLRLAPDGRAVLGVGSAVVADSVPWRNGANVWSKGVSCISQRRTR
jgi:para-aminobenzoate synthetase/4-amino-4-deoxychorismate lyase